MASGPNVAANLNEAERLIGQAVERGAHIVVLPENFAFMGRYEQDKLPIAEQPGGGPIQDFLSAQARRHRIWLVGGTLPMQCTVPGKVRAACLAYNADGQVAARYDKMHLFDVMVPESGERYLESEAIEPGTAPAVVQTPCGVLGLTVCYDLRFPELYRALLDQGMTAVAIPSAFTAVTGRAHWETLVRARAIENNCFVIAAAQGGYHISGRETHGHSMIVDPWGVVLNSLGRGPGVVLADIDPEHVKSLRRSFPAVDHRRLHCH
jgi:nitrilase